MPSIVEDVAAKTEMLQIDPKNDAAMKQETSKNTENEEAKATNMNDDKETENGETEEKMNGTENDTKVLEKEQQNENISKNEGVSEAKNEEVPVEIEPKTGVSLPVKLNDGKQLKAVGMRKKSMLGLGIKIYSFGMYADNEKLTDLMKSKIEKAPAKATKEMYKFVIDSDVGMTVKLVIVFSNLTMSMVRKNFDEGLGAAIKKLTGGKNEELTKKIMGGATDDIKLNPGSEIEISRLPGYVLETRVKGEVVSKVESELLCRAYVYLYLGDDPFDKEAKEKFGMSLISLF